MRAHQGGGRNIMLKRAALLGFLAVLMAGNLAGSVEAGWGGVAIARRATRDITAPITRDTMAGAAGAGDTLVTVAAADAAAMAVTPALVTAGAEAGVDAAGADAAGAAAMATAAMTAM